MKSNNVSSLDISSCKAYLITTYNIPESEIIRIIKLDIVRNDLKVNHVGYEFYAENGTKLEPNNCNVIISSPLHLNETEKEILNFVTNQNENYDIFDISNQFYTDVCPNFESPDGTDVILYDREKDYYLSNYNMCQDNCEYMGFNKTHIISTKRKIY